MPIGDIRYTVLQIVNEVQRKLGLNTTNTTAANKLSVQMVDFVNDVCSDLSDFGNWQETIVSSNVTAVAGQIDYSITTSANIKNIADIYFTQRTGPLRSVTIDQMRLLTRSSAFGMPTQYTIFGTDANGNPNIRVRPTPTSSEATGKFSILYYIRAPLYVAGTNDALVVPYPGDLVTQGVLAKAILNESEGAPTERYQIVQQEYLESRKNSLNRFNGDTGWNVAFTPSLTGRRRR